MGQFAQLAKFTLSILLQMFKGNLVFAVRGQMAFGEFGRNIGFKILFLFFLPNWFLF